MPSIRGGFKFKYVHYIPLKFILINVSVPNQTIHSAVNTANILQMTLNIIYRIAVSV